MPKKDSSIVQVASINGNSEDDIPKDLDELIDIPIEALENVDLELPEEYQDEVFAVQLLDVITKYHQCVVERKALRHQGENTKSEQLSKQAAIYRSQAALIQYEHPNTKDLYKELANAKVDATRKARTRS